MNATESRKLILTHVRSLTWLWELKDGEEVNLDDMTDAQAISVAREVQTAFGEIHREEC